MKVRKLILVLYLLAILLIVIVLFFLQSAIGSQNKIFLQEGYKDLKDQTEKVYQIKNQQLAQFVYDNSFWDELVTALFQKDEKWFTEVLSSSTKTFDFNYIWVMDKEGKMVYQFQDSVQSQAPFFLPVTVMVDSLRKNPFRNFHVMIEGNLVQVITGPIQPSSDDQRKTPHLGYLVCGRKYDPNFMAKLEATTNNIQFGLENIGQSHQTDSIVSSTNTLHHHYTLKDFDGKVISSISTSKRLHFITDYTGYLKKYFLIYLGILVAILLLFYQFLRYRVLRPLNLISNALAVKELKPLLLLKSKKDEFAAIGKSIETFFANHKQLQQEIEQRRKSEKALQKSAQELESATVEKIRSEQKHLTKSEFLSTMSHEIRTPINGIIGIANLLKDENLNTHQKDLVNTLMFSSNHLLSILTDILDFSKIEAGNLKFNKVQFNLKSITESVYNLYAPKAKEKGLDFFILTDDRIVDYLIGDSVRLCQILNNLISNAIKFTGDGKIVIQYKLLNQDIGKQVIEFSISDTGIGIAANKVDSIFESFTQADRTIATNYGGTGLGLTITKKLIELQGGKIAVVSNENRGTTFTFILPFEKEAILASVDGNLLKKKLEANLYGMKILVAEDNKINALIIIKFLEKWNAQPVLVLNGKAALDRLEQEDFDLVLMDLHMPEMDGVTAVTVIRSNKMNIDPDIPIIALTADATVTTQQQILQNGFNQYVTKPFNPENLLKILLSFQKVGSVK